MTNPTSDRHREAAREIHDDVAKRLGLTHFECGPKIEALAEIMAKHLPSPSSGTGELVEALKYSSAMINSVLKSSQCDISPVDTKMLQDSRKMCEEALRNAEAGRQGDGIFWRGGDRYLREHGKEYRLMDLAPNQETRWIKEHAEAGRQTERRSGDERRLKVQLLCGPNAVEVPQFRRGGGDQRTGPADSKPAGERTGATKCGCRVSTGICGCLTFGTGLLDANGFFNNPCPHGSEVHGCNAPSAIGEKGNE